MLTNVDKTIELFEEALQNTGNDYIYFELAYTRSTGWMCWLLDKTGGEPMKRYLATGQDTDPGSAGVACVPVKNFLEAWKRNGWAPRNPPPLVANTDHPFDGKWLKTEGVPSAPKPKERPHLSDCECAECKAVKP